ncbi:MAG: molybdenum cofactor guanylyltransferase [Acidobacteriota bacterium]
MRIEGFILTGGASSRMGRDKATLPFGETTLAGRAFEVLGHVAVNVRVVGESIGGIPGVADVFFSERAGTRASIIGLHSALFHARTEWAAVLACDLPFVSAEFFRRLAAIAEASGENFDAIVPAQPDGKLQPLAALYRRDECLNAVEAMLSENNFRLTEFLNRVNTHIVPPVDYSDLDKSGRLLFNVNTPEELAAAIEKLDD